jgi:hypothetical protein
MLKKYKNALFEAIRDADLDPSIFEATEEQSTLVQAPNYGFSPSPLATYPTFTVHLVGSKLLFAVRDSPSNFDEFRGIYWEFSPTAEQKERFPGSGNYCPFSDVLVSFNTWLTDHVKRQVEENTLPDFWAQARGQKELLEGVPPIDEETAFFSEDEKAQLRFSLQDFKRLVEAEFQPEPEQSELINARLDYLTEAVDRLNRYDWKGVAISTVIGIATTLTLDTQRGQVLWGLFQTALRAAFQLMGS